MFRFKLNPFKLRVMNAVYIYIFFTYKILQYSHWYTSTFVDVTATYQQLWLQHKHCRASFSPSRFSLLLSSLSFLLLIPYTSIFFSFSFYLLVSSFSFLPEISKLYTSVHFSFCFSFISVMFPIPMSHLPPQPHLNPQPPAPTFAFQFPCSVFQACHLICDLCSPLHSADCCCSIMPWLDVMRCLSGSTGATALGSPVAWIHSTAGGQEWKSFRTTGYPAPFIIPSPGVRLLL